MQWGEYIYYSRTVEKLPYHIFCRRPAGEAEGAETVILDVNKVSSTHACTDRRSSATD